MVRAQLLEQLEKLAASTSRVAPALACVRITPTHMQTTNGEALTSVVSTVRDVDTLVPIATLRSVLGALTQDEVELEQSPAGLKVRAGRALHLINGVAVEEFPPERPGDVERLGEVAGLPDALRALAWATAKEERDDAAFMGILLESDGGKLSVVATNRHLLGRMTLDGDLKPFRVNVSVTWAASVARLFGGTVLLAKTGNDLIATDGNTSYRASMLVLQWPDYTRVVPTEFSTRIECSRRELLAATKQAIAYAGPSANAQLGMRICRGKVELAATAESGQMQSEIDASIDGADVDVWMSARYMAQALSHLSGDVVMGQLNGSNRFMRWTAEGPEFFIGPQRRI